MAPYKILFLSFPFLPFLSFPFLSTSGEGLPLCGRILTPSYTRYNTIKRYGIRHCTTMIFANTAREHRCPKWHPCSRAVNTGNVYRVLLFFLLSALLLLSLPFLYRLKLLLQFYMSTLLKTSPGITINIENDNNVHKMHLRGAVSFS